MADVELVRKRRAGTGVERIRREEGEEAIRGALQHAEKPEETRLVLGAIYETLIDGLEPYDMIYQPEAPLPKGTMVRVTLDDALYEGVRCSVCLGILKNSRAISDCLHTFCAECIGGALKNLRNCPVCRKKTASKRSLREYRELDELIGALYGDVEAYERKQEAEASAVAQYLAAQGSQRSMQLAAQQRSNRTTTVEDHLWLARRSGDQLSDSDDGDDGGGSARRASSRWGIHARSGRGGAGAARKPKKGAAQAPAKRAASVNKKEFSNDPVLAELPDRFRGGFFARTAESQDLLRRDPPPQPTHVLFQIKLLRVAHSTAPQPKFDFDFVRVPGSTTVAQVLAFLTGVAGVEDPLEVHIGYGGTAHWEAFEDMEETLFQLHARVAKPQTLLLEYSVFPRDSGDEEEDSDNDSDDGSRGNIP